MRPGFREMLDDITTGRVNGLLAEDLDRIVRDPRDLEDLLDACALTGASARSLSGSLTLTDGGTEAEKSMARVLVAMANKASADTARRVSRAASGIGANPTRAACARSGTSQPRTRRRITGRC